MNRRLTLVAATAAGLLAATSTSPAASAATGGSGGGWTYAVHEIAPVQDARGVDAIGRGRTLVTQADGSFSMITERAGGPAEVVELGRVPAGFVAPAIARADNGTVFILTGAGEPGTGAATLYRWRPGWSAPRPFADIADYQAGDPDPSNQEGDPTESNPFGLATLPDGSALVADAANNDVLRVAPDGGITTVVRLEPRTVRVPRGLPETDPGGGPLPPAGTPIVAESVPTSVAVGPDGEIYVGELRGFPATPGSSQIWRVEPASEGFTCDPEDPFSGECTRWADGLTSIYDLAVDWRGTVYATALSKRSWLQFELGLPGAETGAVYAVQRTAGGNQVGELLRNRFVLPGGIDTMGAHLYLTTPSFGPGQLLKLVPVPR